MKYVCINAQWSLFNIWVHRTSASLLDAVSGVMLTFILASIGQSSCILVHDDDGLLAVFIVLPLQHSGSELYEGNLVSIHVDLTRLGRLHCEWKWMFTSYVFCASMGSFASVCADNLPIDRVLSPIPKLN